MVYCNDLIRLYSIKNSNAIILMVLIKNIKNIYIALSRKVSFNTISGSKLFCITRSCTFSPSVKYNK